MIRPPEIIKKTSSGGVIFRMPKNGVEVVIVSVGGGRTWCLPKGIIDKGEDPPAAALREVREETGLSGEIIDSIGQISYWYFLKGKTRRVHKTVHFYLLRYIEGSTDDHDHEVDDARWFPIDEALEMLSYRTEKGIMARARDMISDMPLNPNNVDTGN